MTMVLAMGMGLMMTAIAVAIGGLAIEAALFLIQYSLRTTAETVNEQTGHAVVISFERKDDLAGSGEWVKEAAA